MEPIEKHGGLLIASGEKFDIVAAMNSSGNSPFFEFFLELYEKYKKQLEKGGGKKTKVVKNYDTLGYYFDRFCDNGPWSNEHQLKALGDGFFEFKRVDTGLRVPFYYDDENRSVVILTHYFEKKKQKTPPKELKRMKDIKDQFEEYRNKEGHYG